jgi:hypothetical protein
MTGLPAFLADAALAKTGNTNPASSATTSNLCPVVEGHGFQPCRKSSRSDTALAAAALRRLSSPLFSTTPLSIRFANTGFPFSLDLVAHSNYLSLALPETACRHSLCLGKI